MSSRKEFRERRRRGFDDDEFLPPRRSKYGRPAPAPAELPAAMSAAPARTAPPATATVKWFNAEKGFGFVSLAEGGDAFLHANVLARAGREEVAPGATLQVRTGSGLKGPQVTEILAIDDSTATPVAPRRTGAGGPRPAAGPAMRMIGTTKWYDPGKGFGFVSVEGRGQDVFVHASVLQKGGLSSLAPGQRVAMDVAEGRRNPEAVSIQLAE